jgi:hypothetical protein
MSSQQEALSNLEERLCRVLEEADLTDSVAVKRRIKTEMESAVAEIYEPGDMTRAKLLTSQVLFKVVACHVEEVACFAHQRVKEDRRIELAGMAPDQGECISPRLCNLKRLFRSTQIVALFFGAGDGPRGDTGELAAASAHPTPVA